MAIVNIVRKAARTSGLEAPQIKPSAIPERIGTLEEEIVVQEVKSQNASQNFAQKEAELETVAKETEQGYEPTVSQEELDAKQDRVNKQHQLKRDISLRINRLETEQRATEVLQQGRDKGQKPYDTLYDVLSKSAGAGNPFSNMESRATAIYTRVSSYMTDVKSNLRTKWAGLAQDRELANEMIRYLKDGKVNDQKLFSVVKEMGEQWKKSANAVKVLRNKAGGEIRKLEDWILPQAHDKRAIKQAGKDAWVKQIKPMLDIDRIQKQSGGDIDDILSNSYDNITSHEQGTGKGGSNLAKKNEEARVLHFKDGDSMIKYNAKFGNEDVFATMENHLMRQSQEISSMQIFGANPDMTYNNLKETIRNEGDGFGLFEENKLDALYNLSTGKVDGDSIISSADKLIATIGGGHRTLQVGAKLGSASISAIADLGNIFLGAKYRGLDSFKVFGKGLETLFQEAIGGTKVGRNTEWANRLGIVSEYASASLANSRFAETTQTGNLASASEAVLRSSGLGSWTNSLRAGFGLELNGKLFQDFGTSFDKLSYKNMMEEYGFTSQDWDKIRSTKGRELKSDSFSSSFLDIEEVYKIDENLGYRLSEMFNTEMDAFVIMPTNRTRVYTTFGKQKGTLTGEAVRNLALFKSFPISVILMHSARLSKMTGKGKIGYTVGATVTSTVFGGLSLLAYDAVTGKTPRSMDRPMFAYESIVKGGGLGIFSDLFGLAESRYGNDWYNVFLGVPFGTGEDISKILREVIKEGTGKDGEPIAEAYNTAKKYIPGQNLWYTRLLFSETLGDFMNEAIDPKYYKKQQKRIKYMNELDQKPLFD